MSGRLQLLPHKSWNVWNKDNIAKVERDEAAHAAKEREDAARTQRADGEARLELLRKRARILRGEDPEAPPPAVAPEAALESDEKRRKQEHVDLFGDLATLEKALGGGASGASAQDRRLGLHAPKASDEASRAGPAPPADDLFASVVADVPWYSAPHDQGRGAREAQKQKLERAEQHAQRKRRADAHTKDREDPLFAMSVILEAKRQLQDINERHGGALDAAYVEQQQRSRAADRRPPRRPPLPVAGPVIADDIRAKAAKHAKKKEKKARKKEEKKRNKDQGR